MSAIKPYIKKVGTFSKFTIWIVDGKYIRDNIDPEFTNFGQHYRFIFIPKNELWIDRGHSSEELGYFVKHMIVQHKMMSEGHSYYVALEHGVNAEKKLRKKSADYRMLAKLNKMKDNKSVLNMIHIKKIKSLSKNLNIWIVNGKYIRDLFFINFTEGGHDKVYNFVPENEVWIENSVSREERKLIILHEIHERNLMAMGMKYHPAHTRSTRIEYLCRRHPEELNKCIKDEFDIMNGVNL